MSVGASRCAAQLSAAHHGRLGALQWIDSVQVSESKSFASARDKAGLQYLFDDVGIQRCGTHGIDTPSMPNIATTMDSMDLSDNMFCGSSLICSFLFTLVLPCLALLRTSALPSLVDTVHTACASTMAAEYDKATLLDVSCSRSRGRRWTTQLMERSRHAAHEAAWQ